MLDTAHHAGHAQYCSSSSACSIQLIKQRMLDTAHQAEHAQYCSSSRACSILLIEQGMLNTAHRAGHAQYCSSSSACSIQLIKQRMLDTAHRAGHALYCSSSRACSILLFEQSMFIVPFAFSVVGPLLWNMLPLALCLLSEVLFHSLYAQLKLSFFALLSSHLKGRYINLHNE